jgi:hypothetical protein
MMSAPVIVQSVKSQRVTVVCGLTLLLALSLQIAWIDLDLDFDEGTHILIARLMEAGYRLYTEIFHGYPPIFMTTIHTVWHLGYSLWLVKLFLAGWHTVLLVAVIMIGRDLLGLKVGLTAVLLLALSSRYLDDATAILADLPATTFGTLAVWLVLLYTRNLPQRYLFLAGFAFGLGMLTKFLIPQMGLILVILLLMDRSQTENGQLKFNASGLFKGSFWQGVGLLAAGIGSSLILVLPFFDLTALYNLTIKFRLAVRAGETGLDNLTQIANFAGETPLLLIGLFLSLAFIRRWNGGLRLLWLWLVLTLGWLLIQQPLRPQHLAALWPVLALLSSWGFWQIGELATRKFRSGETNRSGAVALSIWILIFLLLVYQTGAHYRLGRATEERLAGRQAAIDRIRLSTAPSDCVISDDPEFLRAADRLTAPELAEPSLAAIDSGYLNTARLAQVAEQRDCQAVVVATKRFRERMPDLDGWLSTHFIVVSHERHQDTFLVKRGTDQQPIWPIDQHFSNGLRLIGLDAAALLSDQPNYLSLYWQAASSVESLPKVFIHGRNEQNETIFQVDHFMFDGQMMAEPWPDQATLKETFQFELPTSTEPGRYSLHIGLYDPTSGERLLIEADRSGENAVVIGPIEVR